MTAQSLNWQLEIDVVTVTNDTAGYGTPLTAVATGKVYGTKTLKFGLKSIDDFEPGYENVLENFNIQTPLLKAGLGVAGRATATFEFIDFIGDPDLDSPALTNDPSIEKNGTYFGKLNTRHLLVNRPVRLTALDPTPVYDYTFLSVDLRQSGSDKWVLTCKDVLHKLDSDKSVFPKAYSANVTNTPGLSGTSITLNGNASNWDKDKHVAVSGNDIIPITAVSGTTTTTLTVTRGAINTIGSRVYRNNQEELLQGESVFRGRKYVNADLADIILDIFNDSGITSSYYDEVAIRATLSDWVGVQNIDCIFHSAEPSIDVLDNICQTFLIDIYTTEDGMISVASTSPWLGTTVRFKEGREITYGKGSINISDEKRYSRALLNYALLEQTDDSTYKSSSFKFNSEYEGEYYYDEEKLFNFESSTLLDSKTRDKEIAETSAIRFVNRWAFRPLVADLEINQTAYDQISVGDTLFIEHSTIQDPDGSTSTTVRYQVLKLQPLRNTFYRMIAVSFSPYGGNSDGFTYDPSTGEITATGPVGVNDSEALNLFIQAGSPEPAAQLTEYTFIIDGDGIGGVLGQGSESATIILGDGWASTGITFNIVCLNGAILTAAGGKGGRGGYFRSNTLSGADGATGGNVIYSSSGQTVNVYLSGSRTVQGVTYSCDGYLYAPGGGGGGGEGNPALRDNGGAGAGGAGSPIGAPGQSFDVTNPSGTTPATNTIGGAGEESAASIGGGGGDSGLSGDNGSGTNGGSGGLSGKAIVRNGSAVVLHGDAARFKQGSGDSPSGIIP